MKIGWKRIAIALLLLGLLAFRLTRDTTEEYDEYTAEKRNITQTLELSGEVDAKQKEDLRFLAGGLITYFPFQEGDEVKKFQTIASLDQRQLQKTLEKYLNTYTKQLNTFDSTRATYEDEIYANDISDELRRTLETAQSNLENSVIDVEIQDLAIKLSRIYAPFDGILISAPITSPNVSVLATSTFTVVNPSTLFFLADIDESDLLGVTEGMEVIVELDAYPDLDITSTIDKISYAAKETSTGTTYELDVLFPRDLSSDLRLGLNGTASVIIESKENILTLPIEAVLEDDLSSYVQILENGEIVDKEVETGITDNDYVEILSGLSEGDVVVLEK